MFCCKILILSIEDVQCIVFKSADFISQSGSASGLYSLTARLMSVMTSAVGRRMLRTAMVKILVSSIFITLLCESDSVDSTDD